MHAPVSSLVLLVTAMSCASGGAGHRDSDTDPDPEREERRSSGDEDYDRSAFSSPARGDSSPSVTYGATAEENWNRGEEAFGDEDFAAAQRYFSYIRSKFPYSQYTALSELRIGDCQFARGRHIEAVDSFQNFVRLHPTHEKVPYALFKVGMSYYEQIPGDWFMLPPAEEKEQSAVHDAERVLKDYVERFPKDANAAEGRRVLRLVRTKLFAHERYVADFYRGLGRDRAYVGRLQVIRRSFPDVGLDDALLLEIATVCVRLGEIEEARAAVKELEEKFPASPRLHEARRLAAGG